MRTTRLVAASAMVALLLVPVGAAARQPHQESAVTPAVSPAAAFTATVTVKAYANTLKVSVKVGALNVPTNKSVTGYFLSESPTANPVGSTLGWKVMPSAFTLSDLDGSHTIYVWAKTNNAVSVRGQDVTLLDRTLPTVSAFDVTPTTATTRTVPVTFASADAAAPIAAGVSAYAVVNGTTEPVASAAAWQASPPSTVKLSVGNGVKTVSAFVRDRSGNVSLAGSDVVTLAVPGVSVTLTVPAYTKTQTINIGLATVDSAGSGIKGFIVKETSGTPAVGANWSPRPGTFVLSAGQGTKTLYAWVKDNNDTISAVSTATTVFDTDLPTASLTINTSSPATAWAITVTASGNALGGSPIVKYALVNGTTAPTLGSEWKDVAPTGITLSKGNGTKTVSLFVKDAAGNISAANSKTITLTIPAPTVTVNIVPDNSSNTHVAIGVVTTKGAGTSIAGYFLSDTNSAPALSNPNWKLVTSYFDFTSGDGVKTVYAWVKDNNDSISAVSSDTYRLDTTAPVATLTVTNNISPTVTVAVSGTDTGGSGVALYALVVGITPPDIGDTIAWSANAVDASVGLAIGAQTVTAFVQDAAGNISAVNANSSKSVTKQ